MVMGDVFVMEVFEGWKGRRGVFLIRMWGCILSVR